MSAATRSPGRPSPAGHLQRRVVTTGDEWSAILARLSPAYPLQSWAWGELKGRWGWVVRPVAWFQAERPVAAALVLQRRLPRLPLSMLYVPRGPVLAPDEPGLRPAVWRGLAGLARELGAIFVKIDPAIVRSRHLDPEEPDADGEAAAAELRAGGWRDDGTQVQFRHTVLLDLGPDEETILGSMKQKTRYNIRLAARRGVAVRAAGPDDFEAILALYHETAARDGFAIRPAAYYRDAWHTFHRAGQLQAFVATYEGHPLGAVVLVRQGPLAVYMYGASTDQERQRMPNYLLQWEAIRWAREAGCQLYDLWGAPEVFDEGDPLWGVWRFKAGFNGAVTRFIGAWDYPVRPFWYWLYARVIPRYVAWLRGRPAAG